MNTIYYHTQSCPVYMAKNGQWSSSMSPYCNCNQNTFTKVEETNVEETNKEKARKIFKVFRCRECLSLFVVPIEFRGDFVCEHDKFSTGSSKELIDIDIYEV